jgi:acetoin utilization protein AcuC
MTREVTNESAKTLVVVHSDAYAGWVFDPGHPTQGRRFIKAYDRLCALAPAAGVHVDRVESDLLPDPEVIERVHDPEFVRRVLGDAESGEWAGSRADLAELAHRFVGGTMLAADALIAGRALTAVHFPGAKHHAMRDRSSGFCVFNDFAITARWILSGGGVGTGLAAVSDRTVERIAILDIDAHHGDGTEELLRGEPRVLTFSVHDRTIFPGTGFVDDPGDEVFNAALAAGSGDADLHAAVGRFLGEVRRFDPQMIFIAMGADGHVTDPLSTLTYTVEGMEAAVQLVREAFPAMPILLGGAGGYQPDTVTPEAWARMAIAAARAAA